MKLWWILCIAAFTDYAQAFSTSRWSSNRNASAIKSLPLQELEGSDFSRRDLLKKSLLTPFLAAAASSYIGISAANGETTNDATVTDKIFVMVKGLPGSVEPKRIVIGLFGKSAPSSTEKIKKLVTDEGLAIPCRPKAERALQKEQLEANKVYNSCIEGQDQGVNLQYSSIWRVVKDERIDFGAVSGKFVAREYPDWQDVSSLRHDAPGVVSVRRGDEGGFGFIIYPGNGNDAGYLDDEHVVVGRVLEGMDVVKELNDVPVIASSKVNYMGLTGGTTAKNAPTRSCRYGEFTRTNENEMTFLCFQS